MSTPPVPSPDAGPIPGLGLRSTAQPIRPPRHALGLPAGSVRALLTLMVLGTIWILMLRSPADVVQIPLYLYYLMFLVLGHFFAAHGHSIAGPQTGPASPLYLPRGSLRTVIVLGFAAVLGWRYYVHRVVLQLKPAEIDQPPYLLVVLLVAFFLGVILARVANRGLAGPAGLPYWYQDVLAWLALLAGLGLGAEVLYQLVIKPTLDNPLELPQWQTGLTAVVGFYFGARS